MFLIVIACLFGGMHAGSALGLVRDRKDTAHALRQVLSPECGFLLMGPEGAWTFLLEQQARGNVRFRMRVSNIILSRPGAVPPTANRPLARLVRPTGVERRGGQGGRHAGGGGACRGPAPGANPGGDSGGDSDLHRRGAERPCRGGGRNHRSPDPGTRRACELPGGHGGSAVRDVGARPREGGGFCRGRSPSQRGAAPLFRGEAQGAAGGSGQGASPHAVHRGTWCTTAERRQCEPPPSRAVTL